MDSRRFDRINFLIKYWLYIPFRWCVRHVYIPMVELGYKSQTASIIVFFISAFFHEYLVSILNGNPIQTNSKQFKSFHQVSVPLKTFKIWAFLGMMGQIPLSSISKFMEKKFGPRWGNIVVWSSIILGQPLCIMMYYHDYMITHYNAAFINNTTTQ